MCEKISVLMSLYIKEKPEYVEACFESLLAQTKPAAEWVVVEDGPLTEEMYALLRRYEKNYPGLIRRVSLPENRGLGIALRAGVLICRHELIARMDTDDIARPNRFEKQIEEFQRNPELDICGSHILEFDGTVDNILAARKVPLLHKDIVQYQKTRSAFNHMTVMYKKSAVLRAGNYEDCPLLEDDLLWARMILSGARCMNVDDFLVWARTGEAMMGRRGGWAYFMKYKKARDRILKIGFIGACDYWKALAPQMVAALLPPKVRTFLYVKLLREHYANQKI